MEMFIVIIALLVGTAVINFLYDEKVEESDETMGSGFLRIIGLMTVYTIVVFGIVIIFMTIAGLI